MAFPQIGLEAVLKIQDFERNARKYNKTLDDMDKKTKRTSRAINKSTRNAANSAFDLTKQFREAAGGVAAAGQKAKASTKGIEDAFKALAKPVAVFTAGVGAAVLAIKGLLEAGEEAAALEDLRRSYIALAADSGISAQKLLSDLQSVSRGTIDTATLIKTANSALLAGGAQIADELPQLLAIAEERSRATGQSLDHVFTTLIRGIIKGSPLLIDNAEIYADIADGVEKYANSLGLTTEELDAQQRTMATLSQVLEKGGSDVLSLGESVGAATDPFRQLKVQADAVSTGLKTLLAPAAEFAANSLKGLLTQAKFAISAWGAAGVVLSNFRSNVFSAATAADTFRTEFDRIFQTLTTGINPIEDVEGGIKDIGEAAEESTEKVDEFNKKLADLATQRGERLAKIELQNARRDEDIAIQRARQIEDADKQLTRKREDQARENAKARERIARDNAQRIVEVTKENARKQRDFVQEAQRQREDLERQHQENLFQINQSARDTIGEAARRNDAVAIAAALRQRQRELRDEQRNKQLEQADLSRDLTVKQQKIDEDASLTLEKARAQAAQQLADQQAAETEQEESLKLSLQRQEEDRNLAWQRQNEDLVRARERTLEDLDLWYEKEQEKLKANLDEQTRIAVEGIDAAGTAIAAAATSALNAVAAGSVSLSTGARNRLDQLRDENREIDVDLPQRRNVLRRAEGGVDVVNRPTQFLAGEAGPELAAFVPLKNTQHSLDVSGSVGFDNLPAGMNIDQATALVNETLIALAQRLVIR